MATEQDNAESGKGKEPKSGKGKQPASIRLLQPHGFIDDKEQHRYWNINQVVTDPKEIALLIERGAAIEPVDDKE